MQMMPQCGCFSRLFVFGSWWVCVMCQAVNLQDKWFFFFRTKYSKVTERNGKGREPRCLPRQNRGKNAVLISLNANYKLLPFGFWTSKITASAFYNIRVLFRKLCGNKAIVSDNDRVSIYQQCGFFDGWESAFIWRCLAFKLLWKHSGRPK